MNFYLHIAIIDPWKEAGAQEQNMVSEYDWPI